MGAVSHHDKISPVGAGFLGAGLTAAVMLMSLGVLFFLGFLSVGKRNRNAVHARFGSRGSDSGSEVSCCCFRIFEIEKLTSICFSSPILFVRLRFELLFLFSPPPLSCDKRVTQNDFLHDEARYMIVNDPVLLLRNVVTNTKSQIETVHIGLRVKVALSFRKPQLLITWEK